MARVHQRDRHVVAEAPAAHAIHRARAAAHVDRRALEASSHESRNDRAFTALPRGVSSHRGRERHDLRVGGIGSSNWSLPGLRDDVGWNARIDDGPSLAEAWAAFEALWLRDDVRAIDDAFIDAYARSRPAPTP